MNSFCIKAALAMSLVAAPFQLLAADYTIKLQSYYPPSTSFAEHEFARQVKEESNNRIDVQIFSGGELVESSQVLSAVRTGVIQMARGMGHHFTEMTIGRIESGMPMAWMSADEAEAIYKEGGLEDLISKAYDTAGVKYLGPVWVAPYHILSKRPIKSLDDMRSMKVRAVGSSGKLLAKLGVGIVSMPPEDIYLALTTGQIDAVLYGSAFEFKETKYYEAARFFNKTPIVDPIVDTLIINQKFWNSLPQDLQDVVSSAAEKFRWNYYRWITDKDKATMDEIFKSTSTELSNEDVEELTKAAIAIWEEEAERSDENRDAVEIIKKYATTKGRL